MKSGFLNSKLLICYVIALFIANCGACYDYFRSVNPDLDGHGSAKK